MNNSGKRVLLVDDDDGIQKLMVKLCARRGIQVTVADNKTSITDAITNLSDFSLLFIDLILPEITGWEVLEQIKNLLGNDKKPVIVLTGEILSKAEKEKIMKYANAVIEKKTFSLALFDELLDKHLG